MEDAQAGPANSEANVSGFEQLQDAFVATNDPAAWMQQNWARYWAAKRLHELAKQ